MTIRQKFKSKLFAGTEDDTAAEKQAVKAEKASKKPAKKSATKRTKAASKAPVKSEATTPAPITIPAPTVKVRGNMAPGLEIATELDKAFTFLNDKLFDNKVEPAVVVGMKLKSSYGYFRWSQWKHHKSNAGADRVHEIGIDFLRMEQDGKRSDRDVLSTLAHEMAHSLVFSIDKAEAGETGKQFKPKTYHCSRWADIMDGIGLSPVIMDNHGNVLKGKRTGPQSTHEIVKGGKFDLAAKELLDTGFRLSWSIDATLYTDAGKAMPILIGPGGLVLPGVEPDRPKKSRAGAKAKHTCPHCNANAWGKPSLVMHCKGTKSEPHDLTEMMCERDAFEADWGLPPSDFSCFATGNEAGRAAATTLQATHTLREVTPWTSRRHSKNTHSGWPERLAGCGRTCVRRTWAGRTCAGRTCAGRT